MKTCSATLALFWLASVSLSLSATPAVVGIHAKSQYHENNDAHTETITDPFTREMHEKTYDASGALQMRKHFLLDERGLPTQGNIYDGKNNLVARALLYYDEYNRAKEMRTANLQGEVYQQVLYEYDAAGKAKTPKVINYNVKSPTFKPATIDFTQSVAPPPHLASPGGAQAGQPTGEPQVIMQDGTSIVRQPPVYAPGAEPTGQAEVPKKKSFWKRLFGKDK